MNNPLELIILFFAIVVFWGAFIVMLLAFLRGAARGRDEYESRLPGHSEQPGAYRYSVEHRRGV